MKKLFYSILAVLVVLGLAVNGFAHSISINPKDGPMTITVPVYNNSGGTMDAGDVAIWDIGSSTGDNDNYVKTTTTADTGLVAGVVYPADIAAGDTGTIVIYGIADCDMSSSGVSDGGPICTSTTAGSGKNCASTAGAGKYAIATATIGSNATGKCLVTGVE